MYLLFGGDLTSPYGGWGDFIQNFETKKDAINYAKSKGFEWFDVVYINDFYDFIEVYRMIWNEPKQYYEPL